MDRLRELFDSPLSFDWNEDSSADDISSAIFMFFPKDMVVADLSHNALDAMDGLHVHDAMWAKARKDPLLLPINAVAMEVEFQNLNVAPDRSIFLVEFGAHIFVPRSEVPITRDDRNADTPYFPIGYTMAATDLGNAATIFSTVGAIVSDFIDKHKDRIGGLLFAGKGGSRQKVYRSFTTRLAREFGFRKIEEDDLGEDSIPEDGTWFSNALAVISDQIDETEALDDEGRIMQWYILIRPELID